MSCVLPAVQAAAPAASFFGVSRAVMHILSARGLVAGHPPKARPHHAMRPVAGEPAETGVYDALCAGFRRVAAGLADANPAGLDLLLADLADLRILLVANAGVLPLDATRRVRDGVHRLRRDVERMRQDTWHSVGANAPTAVGPPARTAGEMLLLALGSLIDEVAARAALSAGNRDRPGLPHARLPPVPRAGDPAGFRSVTVEA